MTLLSATHLHFLTAKLAELKEFSERMNSAFQRHYTHENRLNKLAYNAEASGIKAQFESDWELNDKNIHDVGVAIDECEKQMSINNALDLIS